MSWIRDKMRKDLQEDLVDLVELETVVGVEESVSNSEISHTLRVATTATDTIEVLQNKCSMPIAKKRIKLI
jgi:hypothetical protein